jgi:hypothetical protein
MTSDGTLLPSPDVGEGTAEAATTCGSGVLASILFFAMKTISNLEFKLENHRILTCQWLPDLQEVRNRPQ